MSSATAATATAPRSPRGLTPALQGAAGRAAPRASWGSGSRRPLGTDELQHAGAQPGARARRCAVARGREHGLPECGGGLRATGRALARELRAERQRELGEDEHGQRQHRRECGELDRGLAGLPPPHRSTAPTCSAGTGSTRGTDRVTATRAVGAEPHAARRVPARPGARRAPPAPPARHARPRGRPHSQRARRRRRRARTGRPEPGRPPAAAGTAAARPARPLPVHAPPPCEEARSGLRHGSVADRAGSVTATCSCPGR